MPEKKIAYALSFADVIRILKLVDASPFRSVEVELDGLKLHVVRDGETASAATAESRDAGPSAAPPAAAPAATPAPAGARLRSTPAEGIPVLAPLAGTFYRAPAPDAAPFVEVGTAVREGDVIAILEIMKLMNNVTAPCAGVVREICVRNEEFVEFGQLLAVIGPGDSE